MCQFSGKTDIYDLFSLNLPKKMDLGLEIQKANVQIRIRTLKIAAVAIFQAKQTTLTFLAQIYPKTNFGGLEFRKSKSRSGISTSKRPYVRIFCPEFGGNCPIISNILVLIMLRLFGASWRLKVAVWRWMGLGGGGWIVL